MERLLKSESIALIRRNMLSRTRAEHRSKSTQEPRGWFGALFYGVQEKVEFDCSGEMGQLSVLIDGVI